MAAALGGAAALAAAPAAPVPAPADAPADAPAEGPRPAGRQEPMTVFELLQAGGPIMYPIYGCSILMVAFAIERAVSLRRRRILPPEFVLNVRSLVSARPIERDKIQDYCRAHSSPIARIFQAAVKRLHRPMPEIEKSIEDAGAKEVVLLRRNGRVLAGVASVSPLLGLLGTVLGMIQAFQEISMGEGLGKAEMLASGIYQALVTTAAGLTVAIPALVLYLMFNAKIEKLVSDMDDLTLEFVETLDEEARREAA
jgi:biopolymer transport protein ExbB